MDGYFLFRWPSDEVDPRPWETFIVYRDAERIVTQASFAENGRRVVAGRGQRLLRGRSADLWGDPAKIGLSAVPSRYEWLEGVKAGTPGLQGCADQELLMIRLVGVFLIYPHVVGSEEASITSPITEELEKVKADRWRRLSGGSPI